ncbi:hypothetical protein AB0G60_03705 [Streptomyces angustmyceticus]|uniref:hypothetical protein n=1 Tax=Streptomyces angustmyceticus TaxID=285578 RepID=UPI00117E843A|nr:hypothetical protein [Streptomyces angustmyceticus]UAL65755.1 hypothetical protein K7396_03670 [Streptomyces angustmyceticus]
MVHLVLRHLSRPVHGNTYMRGVLPPQGGEEAVCVAVGTKDACAPDLNVYEIPLIQDEIIIAAGEVLQIVRAAQTADPFYRTFYRDDEGDLSQMPSLALDLLDIRGGQEQQDQEDQEEPAVLTPETKHSTDRANLVGFLPLASGRHRLYWSCGDWPGIIASDVETSNSPEALEAVVAHGLPDTRRAQPSKDLYCWKIAPLLES